MNWNQVPLEEQGRLYQAFLNNQGIIKLSNLASEYIKTKQYIQALETKKEITAQWEYVKQQHLKDYDKVIEETVKLSDLHLSEEILHPLLENIISIFMCCCIIETAHFNANEILKKVNPDYSMDNFADLVSLIDNVNKKLKYLQVTTGYMDDLYWYDICDKFHDMVRNKARSILKRKDDINRWKGNLKKYIDGTV